MEEKFNRVEESQKLHIAMEIIGIRSKASKELRKRAEEYLLRVFG